MCSGSHIICFGCIFGLFLLLEIGLNCRDELYYALLSWLFYGNSQLVIVCFALLRSLAPQLIENYMTTTAEAAEPSQGGAMFNLTSMHTCMNLSDCVAASARTEEIDGVDRTSLSDQVNSSITRAAEQRVEFISSCCALRVQYGDWAERVVQARA